jgi:type IV pilus assembly protein PilM
MGTDATDLIVTNGIRLWLRNIPIGGNHFTKELSRELKLTHAKAEQLKRNARLAEDPKTVFQAMRRVFNDLKKEIERSLSFYSGIDKHAKLDRIVLLGNAAQLPGLRQFLNKQLEMDIVKLNDFPSLKGAVTDERAFQENLLAFTPAYGLCLQGLRKSAVNTNLLPLEFVNERIIRAKKPWVLASVSLLMLGMLFSYFFVNQRWWAVNENYAAEGHSWKEVMSTVSAVSSRSAGFVEMDESQRETLKRINAISSELAEAADTRASWAEILSAIDQLLPRDPRMFNEDGKLDMVVDPEAIPFEDRKEVYLSHIDTAFFEDLTTWGNSVIAAFQEQRGNFEALDKLAETKKKAATSRSKKQISLASDYDISGPGWVIELKGYHYFNSEQQRLQSQHGLQFVIENVLDPFVHSTVKLPNKDGVMEDYKFEDIGLYYPTIVSDKSIQPRPVQIRNPKFGRQGKDRSEEEAAPPAGGENESRDDAAAGGGEAAGEDAKKEEKEQVEYFKVMRYDFSIQMACKPVSAAVRDANKAARIKEEQERAKALPADEKGTGNSGDAGDAGTDNN